MSLKARWQNYIQSKADARYNEEYELKSRIKSSYDNYIAYKTTKEDRTLLTIDEAADLFKSKIVIKKYSELTDTFDFDNFVKGLNNKAYVIFVKDNGMISASLLARLKESVSENQGATTFFFHEGLVQADMEAECSSGYGRHNPWFKAEWFLESYFSYFSFGSAVIFSAKALKSAEYIKDKDPIANLYYIGFQLTKDNRPVLINSVLYHGICNEGSQEATDYYGYTPGATIAYKAVKEKAMKLYGINGEIVGSAVPWGNTEAEYCHLIYKAEYDKISIVIPSKDHPDVLERCVSTIRKYTEYPDYEIVVVDNGSSNDNKEKYQLLSEKYSFAYYYEPMDFNFSVMCNLGVRKSTGKYILLLNDDMEVLPPCGPDWLTRMHGTAAQSTSGAVGAKLLYPESSFIQHVGISNMLCGPTHKLSKDDDKVNCYHGKNRVNLNMIGVTAACLMVSREKFDQVGGLDEELKVAFNDVAFNFKLDKAGYKNIVRNDVVLYHHESLSRGVDTMTYEKYERMVNEWRYLYSKYRDYHNYDPYYSDGLNGENNSYECWCSDSYYVFPWCKNYSVITDDFLKSEESDDICCRFEHTFKIKREIVDEYHIINFRAHVNNMDNALFTFYLVLKGEDEKIYQVEGEKMCRPDLVAAFPAAMNVGLGGYTVKVSDKLIPGGTYEAYIKAESKFYKKSLYKKFENTDKVDLQIEI